MRRPACQTATELACGGPPSHHRGGSVIRWNAGRLNRSQAILEIDPPNRLAMTFQAVWDDDVRTEPPPRVTWELEVAGPGVTKLSVVHDGLAGAPATAHPVAGGWPRILAGLRMLLETGQPLMPPAEAHIHA